MTTSIEKLRSMIAKYDEQLKSTSSAKVMNACVEKIIMIQREIKLLEKKERKSQSHPSNVYSDENENTHHPNQSTAERDALLKAEEAARKANEEARRAKAYASKIKTPRNQRALPAKQKVSTRSAIENAHQERKRTNLEAKSANAALKQAATQLNTSSPKETRKAGSARLFDRSSCQDTTQTKSNRSNRKI